MAKTEPDNAVTFVDGQWHDGSPAVIKPRDHGFWLASNVFDGARSIIGRVPDLDLHCQRLIKSAEVMGMTPTFTAEEIASLAEEGVKKFPAGTELYICPMFYPDGGFIVPDSASTQFLMHISISPLPAPDGFSACQTQFRRPAQEMAPTEAKASCLYPNVARGLREANAKGFDTAVVLDPNGNVAEFSYTNLFMVKDGVIHTPEVNGTFLNGITRQRIIQLLRQGGHEVLERIITYEELFDADELFGTGNYAKILPCTRIEVLELQPGPIYTRARELYFEFASDCG